MDDERTTNGGAAPLHADERERAYAEALHQTALAAMRRLDPSEVLETIVTRAAALAGAAHGYAYLRDATTDELEVRCGVGVFTEWIGYRLRVGEGMAGRVRGPRPPPPGGPFHLRGRGGAGVPPPAVRGGGGRPPPPRARAGGGVRRGPRGEPG